MNHIRRQHRHKSMTACWLYRMRLTCQTSLQVRLQRPAKPACRTIEGTMRLIANWFAALLVLFMAQAASAQSNYPNRPVKILVGFTPGTAPDLAARILADRFTEVWGTPV